jgi:ABC-type multidrug transport system fused ATPase/permease subunit
VNVWAVGWRLAMYRPGLFAAGMLLWGGVHVLPLAIGYAISLFFRALTGEAPAGINAWTVIAMLAGIEITRAVVHFNASYWWNKWWLIGMTLMRANMLAWIVRGIGVGTLPSTTGETLNRFRDDTEAVVDFVDTWLDVTGSGVYVLMAAAVLATISPLLTVIVLLPALSTIVFTQAMTGRIVRYRRDYRRTSAEVSGFLGEAFGAVQALKVGGAERHAIRHFGTLGDARRHAAVRDRVFTEFLAVYGQHSMQIAIGVVLLVTAEQMRDGSFTVGDFALFATYVGWFSGFPRWVGWLIARQKQATVSVERMLRLLKDAPPGALVEHNELYLDSPMPVPAPVPVSDADRLRELTVVALSSHYGSNGRGVADVTFTVPRGAFVVVTGRVGSGKTTLLRALLGLIDRDEGEILWNGRLVNEPGAFLVPPRVAYLPQAPRLFSETLEENIRLGLPRDAAALETALSLAVLDRDVAEMHAGVGTLVGARGLRLSGGQLQRTAAARMFIREPELLVFDDISSALDVETEHVLWQRLFAQRDATCLVVSNRRAALERADLIVLLDDGRHAAVGTLEELRAASPLMRELWERAT